VPCCIQQAPCTYRVCHPRLCVSFDSSTPPCEQYSTTVLSDPALSTMARTSAQHTVKDSSASAHHTATQQKLRASSHLVLVMYIEPASWLGRFAMSLRYHTVSRTNTGQLTTPGQDTCAHKPCTAQHSPLPFAKSGLTSVPFNTPNLQARSNAQRHVIAASKAQTDAAARGKCHAVASCLWHAVLTAALYCTELYCHCCACACCSCTSAAQASPWLLSV
jgi:hypothetical protein